jgi:2-methylcitrate dehydratase PrpD
MTREPQALTRGTAEFVANHPRIDAVATDAAKKAIADSIACIVAGANSELAPALKDYLGRTRRNGDVTILGTRLRADAESAALVNGTHGHALDYDDGTVLTPVHPSVAVVTALLAGAGAIAGDRYVDAYAIGVEVAVKLGVGIGIDHYERGFHGTGTIGIFGAVAALARARGLDVPTIEAALGIAASMASGLQCNFGTMVKPLHTGLAARNALTAIELATSGVTAAHDALEHRNGLFAAFGSARSSASATLDALGAPLAIIEPGMSLKRYACCYASHRPMQALLEARRALSLTADNVEQVTCTLAPGSLRALIYPRPRTGLEGKFSLEYALAAGVLDGRYTLWTFTDDAVRRPEAQALLPRMIVGEDERCAAGDPQARHVGPSRRGHVELCATTRDGRVTNVRVQALPGSPDQPLSWDEVRAKFDDCAASASLNADDATQAWQRLHALERVRDVAEVTKLLVPR